MVDTYRLIVDKSLTTSSNNEVIGVCDLYRPYFAWENAARLEQTCFGRHKRLMTVKAVRSLNSSHIPSHASASNQ
eukprot:scaffold147253_cov17-Prasinocladus_malaysianus.AAC.1